MLYIVATPIGNLGDMSARAIEVLRNVEYILCEDTRTSLPLLQHYDISKKLISYHKYNEAERCENIARDIECGKDVALISDAGMPGISDPGAVIVRYLRDRHLPYTVIPGASALINAFVLSGYDAPFTFVGFLPEKAKAVRDLLATLKESSYPTIYYVSPHSIAEFFATMYAAFGDREVCVVRELTKKFEEVVFTTLSTGYNGVVKGEFVIVVRGRNVDEANKVTDEMIVSELNALIGKGCSKKDASSIVAEKYRLKKNYVYNLSIK